MIIYDDDAHTAYGLVTGFIPTDLMTELRHLTRSEKGDVPRFIRRFKQSCSQLLWWSTWSAARNATSALSEDDTSYVSACSDDESGDSDDLDI